MLNAKDVGRVRQANNQQTAPGGGTKLCEITDLTKGRWLLDCMVELTGTAEATRLNVDARINGGTAQEVGLGRCMPGQHTFFVVDIDEGTDDVSLHTFGASTAGAIYTTLLTAYLVV